MAAIRSYFVGNALEAEVPSLGAAGVTDPNIDNIPAAVGGAPAFLQSSPEYFLKRLLASGSGDLYYLGKAFRDGESGSRHNAEFTLLEWYRRDWDEQQLADEVIRLVSMLAQPSAPQVNRFHYGDIFRQITGVNPHSAALSELRQLAADISGSDFSGEPRSTCLDLIFSLAVEPRLPTGLTLIDSYPACQCALAKLDKDAQGNSIARRFEAFIDGLEIANGYWELTDADELLTRFTEDISLRNTAGKKTMVIDRKLVSSLQHGLPECAGVALGVDRLLMYLLGADNIRDVLAFPLDAELSDLGPVNTNGTDPVVIKKVPI